MTFQLVKSFFPLLLGKAPSFIQSIIQSLNSLFPLKTELLSALDDLFQGLLVTRFLFIDEESRLTPCFSPEIDAGMVSPEHWVGLARRGSHIGAS